MRSATRNGKRGISLGRSVKRRGITSTGEKHQNACRRNVEKWVTRNSGVSERETLENRVSRRHGAQVASRMSSMSAMVSIRARERNSGNKAK